MDKCFCSPNFILILIAAGLLILAYVSHLIVLALFPRLFHGEEQKRRVKKDLRYPLLLFFLSIAAGISFSLFEIDDPYRKIIGHAVTVFFIIGLGWLIGSLTHVLYHSFLARINKRETHDSSYRSMVTQSLFFYRFTLFLIVLLTLSAIFLSFPYIRSIGVGILGSAGIMGIALGIAARPILLNLMAGFQIALTKMIKIGDAVKVEGDFSRIESIHLTHVVAKTWDFRRLILPISYFIDKPFQNWDAKSSELLSTIFLYCDYTVPVDAVRDKVQKILEATPLWNRKTWGVHVTNVSERAIEIRAVMSADDASKAFELGAHVREKVVEFLQKEYPQALPCVRQLAQGVDS